MRRKLGGGALLVLLIIGGAVQARGQESELTPSAAFWKTLGDTTLVRRVGEVVKSKSDVVAARARLRGARASRLQAALDFAPTVTATASYTRQRFASASFPGSFGTAFPDQSVWDAGLQLSWELDVFGRIRKTTQGRGALSAAAEEDVQALQVQNPETVVRLRPDVRSAERQLAAGNAFVGAAKAAYLPRIALGGGVGYVGTSFEALGNSNTPRYAIGPVISWPALNLGRVKAGVDLARAQEAEAQAYYRKTQPQAAEEIATSVVTSNEARRRLEDLEAAARARERAAALARLR